MEFAIATAGEVTHLALSPDGSMLAYVSPDENTGEGVIYVQRVGSHQRDSLGWHSGCRLSLLVAGREVHRFLRQRQAEEDVRFGRRCRRCIAKAENGRGGTWGKKNIILYSPSSAGPLWRVNPDGSDAAPLTEKLLVDGESSHRWPCLLAGWRALPLLGGQFPRSVRRSPHRHLHEFAFRRQERPGRALPFQLRIRPRSSVLSG